MMTKENYTLHRRFGCSFAADAMKFTDKTEPVWTDASASQCHHANVTHSRHGHIYVYC